MGELGTYNSLPVFPFPNVNSNVLSVEKIKCRRSDYSWQDESKGEIYKDRDAAAAAVPVGPETLYVVENSKEYPLASVSKRRSLFVSQARITKHSQNAKEYIRAREDH